MKPLLLFVGLVHATVSHHLFSPNTPQWSIRCSHTNQGRLQNVCQQVCSWLIPTPETNELTRIQLITYPPCINTEIISFRGRPNPTFNNAIIFCECEPNLICECEPNLITLGRFDKQHQDHFYCIINIFLINTRSHVSWLRSHKHCSCRVWNLTPRFPSMHLSSLVRKSSNLVSKYYHHWNLLMLCTCTM